MPPSTYAFIDLETTGGRAGNDRIIEIGLRLWRDGEILEDWQTLINPKQRISPFIEQFTGINNAMVADAPVFADVADQLRDKLEDCVLVAHNARFDYGFIKSEYRRLGQAFSAPVLCTVKLSRRLFPEHRRHNMDTLIQRHGLDPGPRHRAMGDVETMHQFFLTARQQVGEDRFEEALRTLLQRPSVPSHLPHDLLDSVPDGPGVYRFYGENDVLLYVGKSTRLKQRIASHFSGDHNSSRGVQLSQSLRRVEWTETAGELGALLLELKQIKGLKPLYNRRSRAAKRLASFRLGQSPEGYLTIDVVRDIDTRQLGQYYGLFRGQQPALKALRGLTEKNRLCNKRVGLEEPGPGPCFQRQLGHCLGACEGEEDVTRYNLRVQIALHSLRLNTWPWSGPVAVTEHHPDGLRRDIHVIDNWTHLATVHDPVDLEDWARHTAPEIAFDLDSYKLITKYLLAPGHRLQIEELTP